MNRSLSLTLIVALAVIAGLSTAAYIHQVNKADTIEMSIGRDGVKIEKN